MRYLSARSENVENSLKMTFQREKPGALCKILAIKTIRNKKARYGRAASKPHNLISPIISSPQPNIKLF